MNSWDASVQLHLFEELKELVDTALITFHFNFNVKIISNQRSLEKIVIVNNDAVASAEELDDDFREPNNVAI